MTPTPDRESGHNVDIVPFRVGSGSQAEVRDVHVERGWVGEHYPECRERGHGNAEGQHSRTTPYPVGPESDRVFQQLLRQCGECDRHGAHDGRPGPALQPEPVR